MARGERGFGRDMLFAGNGEDILIGGGGSDMAMGQAGDDRLYAESELTLAAALTQGNTQVASGLKGDWLDGGAGNDTMIGDAGNDALAGGGGNDLMLGGGGDADHMEGGRGLEIISGGADDVALRQGHAGDKPGAAFASGVRRSIQTMQHPARQRDVHPLHLVIQHGRVDTHHRPNPIVEIRVTRAQRIDRRRLRNRLASIKHGLNPADYRLFGIDHRLIQRISG